MTWETNVVVDNLPLVLAGPILRRVNENSVTVWFALRERATVKLTVSDPSGPILTGQGDTCAVGSRLHIVAVKAATLEPTRPVTGLAEGVIYHYDARFELKLASGVITAVAPDLAAATKSADISYDATKKPSFCLPPRDQNKLRLMHGSCRRTNADGADALALLDPLIAQVAAIPDLRPHQLFMGGDQIYADDLPASLIMMLGDVSKKLLGWEEKLPLPASLGGSQTGLELEPIQRKFVGEAAGLTTGDGENHLFSLGEYLCMYLFVWSPVLSDAMSTPRDVDIATAARRETPVWKGAKDVNPPRDYKRAYRETEIEDALPGDRKNLENFRKTLGSVRKILANIPTYMIMDDHEITDDFNMTRDCCEKVYSNDLGRRIIQNGLVAYALCQHWGNVPEQFVAGAPGFELLGALKGGDAETYKSLEDKIQSLVGVHKVEQLTARNPFAVFHDAASLTYDYTVEGPGHQVLVCDTRTWRAFPNGRKEPGELLPKSEITRQVSQAGKPTAGRALLVLIPTNAPPTPVIRFGEQAPSIAAMAQSDQPAVDVPDSWTLPSPPLDRLLKAISDRLPKVGADRTGAAVLLSGDTHHGFATRMTVKGRRRFEDTSATPDGVNMIIVQMVCSAFRNQTGDTIGLHGAGYTRYWMDANREGYYGWVQRSEADPPVGTFAGPPFGKREARAIGGKTYRKETLVWTMGQVTVEPDYRYAFRYLPANKEGSLQVIGDTPLDPLKGVEPADRQRALQKWFGQVSGFYRTYDKSKSSKRQIVGYCNLGEINFNTADKVVLQTLRWYGAKAQVMLSTYVASLDPKVTDIEVTAAVVRA